MSIFRWKLRNSVLALLCMCLFYLMIGSKRNTGALLRENCPEFSHQISRHSRIDKDKSASESHENTSTKCAPLRPIKFLKTADATVVDGTYMTETDEERELATFLMQPWSLSEPRHNCKEKMDLAKWSMVLMVKSSAKHRDRRDVIRQTWGSWRLVDVIRLEVVFLLGTTKDPNLRDSLEEESSHHGDILQMDMEDSAETVPEKVLAGMQWASSSLTHDWIYSSVDDDMVVHVENLVEYMKTLLVPEDTNVNIRPCYEQLPIVCVYSYQAKDSPDRNPLSKWYISYGKMSDNYWPKYCRGGMYLMSVEMAGRIFQVSRRTPYLYLDDVWITGYMRRKLNEGDCNIMPAPNSIKTNKELYFNTGVTKPLVRHLFGNIRFFPVKVPDKLLEIWQSWEVEAHGPRWCQI
ncbi:unnamed protein product [Clavelina lepadiformis]|uniref:Hexosyltransferase n=1 Tax=Clavelina lepadiformis TaxID=159417 RepID=A0ABP0GH83_CLALP